MNRQRVLDVISDHPSASSVEIYDELVRRSRAGRRFGEKSVVAALFGPNVGNMSAALARLENEGLICSDWDDAGRTHEGYRLRRYWVFVAEPQQTHPVRDFTAEELAEIDGLITDQTDDPGAGEQKFTSDELAQLQWVCIRAACDYLERAQALGEDPPGSSFAQDARDRGEQLAALTDKILDLQYPRRHDLGRQKPVIVSLREGFDAVAMAVSQAMADNNQTITPEDQP